MIILPDGHQPPSAQVAERADLSHATGSARSSRSGSASKARYGCADVGVVAGSMKRRMIASSSVSAAGAGLARQGNAARRPAAAVLGAVGWHEAWELARLTRAVVMCSAVEWQTPPTAPALGELEGRIGLAAAKAAGMLHPIDAATVELGPGIRAHHSPGHTPGHYVVSVSSNGESAYLLGDVVHHPLQLNDKGISFLSETEPERALRAREELLTALQGCNVSIGMTHFPGLDFQRITTANGREWTTAG